MDERTVLLQHYENNPFSDKAIRNGFIRKVYLLLSIQLVITFGICAVFIFVENVRLYAYKHPSLMLSAIICTFVLILVFSCFQSVQRTFPWNFLALLGITLSMSYLLGTITASYEVYSVLMALGICVIACVGVSLFAINTRYDFTSCYGVLFMVTLVLILWGFLFLPFIQTNVMNKVYAGIGAVVFLLYLAADTQMIMGNRSSSFSPEDYIAATLTIYLDVINIFLFILQLFGERR